MLEDVDDAVDIASAATLRLHGVSVDESAKDDPMLDRIAIGLLLSDASESLNVRERGVRGGGNSNGV